MILKDLLELDESKQLGFIQDNKEAILKAKKGQLKEADSIVCLPKIIKSEAIKELASGQYEIVGNSVGFMDSHNDVSIRGSFDKTVRERGSLIPILVNHNHSPKSIFAKNLGVSVKDIVIKDLGFDAIGTTQALTAIIEPKYDREMAMLYADGEIKQHSIGLKYVNLQFAVNDKDDAEGFANWNKYISQVINRQVAEDKGYFFPVLEQQIFEISAVVFGSNIYTPTISLATEPQKSIALRFGEPKKLNFSLKF